mmetsp:Transcript_19787/g.62944  ORF Transcript_19787/g.62944 Transcript_19787/m.62944 type:complete len:213 (+) Transcript_19787:118-756(+)
MFPLQTPTPLIPWGLQRRESLLQQRPLAQPLGTHLLPRVGALAPPAPPVDILLPGTILHRVALPQDNLPVVGLPPRLERVAAVVEHLEMLREKVTPGEQPRGHQQHHQDGEEEPELRALYEPERGEGAELQYGVLFHHVEGQLEELLGLHLRLRDLLGVRHQPLGALDQLVGPRGADPEEEEEAHEDAGRDLEQVRAEEQHAQADRAVDEGV